MEKLNISERWEDWERFVVINRIVGESMISRRPCGFDEMDLIRVLCSRNSDLLEMNRQRFSRYVTTEFIPQQNETT